MTNIRAYKEYEVGQYATDILLLNDQASYYVNGDIMRAVGWTSIHDILDYVRITYPPN